MSQTFTTQGLQEMFAFPFHDPRWKNKLLIAGLLNLASLVIPIVPGLFFYGYCARIMRRITVQDGEPFLPEWDDWGQMLAEGWRLFAVGLVYSLPSLLLMLLGFALYVGLTWVPLVMAETAPSSPEWIVAPLAAMGAGMVIFGLATIVSLITLAILPAPLNHALVAREFRAAFRPREWWPIFRANLGGFLLSFAILMGVNFVLSFAAQILYMTIVLCCLVPFALVLAATYLVVVASALFAQAYRTGAQNLAAVQDPLPSSRVS